MIKRIRHEELKGGYSMGRKIIIDAAEIFGDIEVMAMYENGEEIESKNANTEAEAIEIFDEMFLRYAEPLQKALYNKLEAGEKYTFVYLSEFGFPVAEKITFHSMKAATYAQHSDGVKMIFTPYRKRSMYEKHLFNKSLVIFKGWHDLKDEDTNEVLKNNATVKITRSKYACFDSRYIDDLENVFGNPVVVFKNYKTGVNGRTYA